MFLQLGVNTYLKNMKSLVCSRNFFKIMILSIFLAFSSALCLSNESEASNSLTEVALGERNKIVGKLNSLQSDIRSISASVRQERHLTALKKKVVVNGTIVLAKPDKLRWDVSSPSKMITALDGETMTVYHPDIKEAQVYVLSEDMVARNTSNFLVSVFNSGSLNELEKKFNVAIFKGSGEIVFKMTPLSNIVRRYIEKIIVFYNPVSGLPQGFDMYTPKGDRTITRLSDIKINPAVKPGLFTIALPDDVWITNQVKLTDH